jgi:N-acetylglucosamine-6-phosphate deacetylase
MQYITAKYIFDGKKLCENSVVVFENNIIIDIMDNAKITQMPQAAQKQIINYGDGVICAGFIDLQLNGCGGVSFNDDISQHALEIMYQTCLRYGTTSFLPTLITCDFSDVILALETIKEWFNKYGNHRGVIGLHLEGPFIAKRKKGIHPEVYIIKPTDQLLAQIVSYTKYFPLKMTIAVEEFTAKQIEFLVQSGVILAVGHSVASYQRVTDSIKCGVKAATHVFNAMSGLTARDSGVIGGVLNNDDIYAGIIADLLHVDIANLQLLYKLKQANKMYLVTDAVAPTGTDMKEFNFAGKTLHVVDGKCIDDSGVIGGANLVMPMAIKNCVQYCGVSLEAVLAMTSLTPAVVMQLGHELGIIKTGYRANLIYLDLEDYTTILIHAD